MLDVLWVYSTLSRIETEFSPYSLVYGSKAISLVELLLLSARMPLVNDIEWDADACALMNAADLETTEEL